AAETWLKNEPPCSITTWDDLVSKFLNRFFPHSKTRELRKEITNFQQVFGETFTEAWERFKDLLRKCPHHGFSLLYQIDFFYNGLSQSDQDSLNTAAGGNLMMRSIREAFTTIENKAKVRTYLENPTGCANHFIYRIDIVDSLCDKFSIENNSMIGNPTPSSDSLIESTSLSPIPCMDSDSLMEETVILISNFDDYPPEYETFSFDIKENSSGSTTIHSDYSLPDYDAFYFDDNHIEEKSSGSTTTHSDFSLSEYDSFIFDLLIDLFPAADRSVSHHEEFADELAHIISPLEYDRFTLILRSVQESLLKF
ncbi:putative reverse transcriptase domain-containing protein, partial [Tanacetum coccineum]